MSQFKETQQFQEDQYFFPYHYSDLGSVHEKYFRKFEYLNLLRIVKKSVSPFNNQSILDVGCGDGRLCYELKDENCTIVGIDYSERATTFARAFSPNVTFYTQDIKDIKLPSKFDTIILMEVLEHFVPSKIPSILTRLSEFLKDDGQLVITVPSTNVKLHKKHFQHFTTESLAQTIDPFFKIKEINGFGKKGIARIRFNLLKKIGILAFTFARRFKISKRILVYQDEYFFKNISIGNPEKCGGLIAICEKNEI